MYICSYGYCMIIYMLKLHTNNNNFYMSVYTLQETLIDYVTF